MSLILKAQNQRGNLSITRDNMGYAYLGKFLVGYNSTTLSLTASFNCVGFPLIFISLPYNVVDNNPAGDYRSAEKAGVSLAGLVNNGGNSWTATVLATGPGDAPIYLRVFGKLQDNWPNGSGRVPNMVIKTDQGSRVFDAGVRMLKLAGDTYNTELTLLADVPADNEPNNKYDTSVGLPFDLNNKSIAATTRSTIGWPYQTGTYIDSDTGQTINQYDVAYYNTVFAGQGSTLQIKRSVTSLSYFEQVGSLIILNTGVAGYSRLSVIDNTKFP